MPAMKIIGAAASLLVAILLAGACGSSGTGGGAKPLRVEGTEMSFTAPNSVAAGTYDVTFANVGKVPHELAIVDPTGEVLVRRSIAGGEQATLEGVKLTPGTWELACHELGHYESGMKRPLQVTAGAGAGN
jgi:plastocyanin